MGRTLEEIERQIRVLQAEAEEFKTAEGIEQLRIAIKKYDLGLHHFKMALGTVKKAKQSPRKLPPAYRNPDNDAETWTGRGRKPRWLVTALKEGKTVEQCKIVHPAPPDVIEIH